MLLLSLFFNAPDEDARFRGTVRAFEADADGRSESLGRCFVG